MNCDGLAALSPKSLNSSHDWIVRFEDVTSRAGGTVPSLFRYFMIRQTQLIERDLLLNLGG